MRSEEPCTRIAWRLEGDVKGGAAVEVGTCWVAAIAHHKLNAVSVRLAAAGSSDVHRRSTAVSECARIRVV